MKASLKIQFIILFLFPFIACASFYVSSALMDKSSNKHPSEGALNVINTSNDIEIIRDFALTYMKGYIDTQQSNTEINYSFAKFLFALAILNTILLYSIYKTLEHSVANK